MKTLFTAIILTFAANISAQNEVDTLTFVRPDSVTLVTKDSRLQVVVNGKEGDHDYVFHKEAALATGEPVVISEHTKEWDFTLPLMKKKRYSSESSDVIVSGLCLGWTTAVNAPEGMNVDMGESFEIMWPYILGWNYAPKNSRFSFSAGVGVNWRNVRMTGKTRFIKDGTGITLGEYPEGADIEFSRLKIFSWIVPLTIDYEITAHLGFTFGPIVNFNTYGSLKTRYKLDGQKQKDFDKHIHQRRTTVDLFAALHYHGVGVYVKYNPCRVLKEDMGPSFNVLSTGLTLFY